MEERLGPEPLDDLSSARLGALLAGRRGRLKSLLLDQRFLAGLGNLYADEALFHAKRAGRNRVVSWCELQPPVVASTASTLD